MIWHIFCKDWKLLKGPAIALAIVQLAAGAWFLFLHSEGSALMAARFLGGVSLIGELFLVAALGQQEIIPGHRQDWLIRPIRRRDLLLAKLTFVLLVLQGSKFVGDLLEGFFSGLSFSTSLSTAFWRGAWMFASLSLPCLACSSTFASPVTMVFVSLILVVFTPLIGTNIQLLNSGTEWIPQVGVGVLTFVAAAGVLALTYLRRRVITARMLLAAAFLMPFGMARLSWPEAFALQQRLSPVPGAARDIVLTPLPGTEMDAKKRILVTGLAPDALLHVDKAGFGNDLNQAPFWRDHGQAFLLHDLARGRGSVDYYITLLQVASVESFPATGGSHGVPGVGRCISRINPENTAVQLDCLEDARMPPCYSVNLEHIPTGAHNFESSNCIPDYSPVKNLLGRPSQGSHAVQINFRDAADSVHYPVNEAMLPESRIVMRIYEARDHFMRRLTF